MIMIGICDDDRECRKILCGYCQDYLKNAGEIREYPSGNVFLEIFKQKNVYEEELVPDILLLDIEMAGASGIDVKKQLARSELETRILFITNHDEMMEEAYGKHVFGFLKKPFTYEKFKKKMDEIMEDVDRGRRKAEVITGKHDREMLFLSQIIYLKSAKPYTEVYFVKRGQMLKKLDERGIGRWEEELRFEDFFLIDRSYLINLAHVENARENKVWLDNGMELKISRRKKTMFWDIYKKYLLQYAK